MQKVPYTSVKFFIGLPFIYLNEYFYEVMVQEYQTSTKHDHFDINIKYPGKIAPISSTTRGQPIFK